jgi:hypothetical protein
MTEHPVQSPGAYAWSEPEFMQQVAAQLLSFHQLTLIDKLVRRELNWSR